LSIYLILPIFISFVSKVPTGSVKLIKVLKSKYCVPGTFQSSVFFFFFKEGVIAKLIKYADTLVILHC